MPPPVVEATPPLAAAVAATAALAALAATAASSWLFCRFGFGASALAFPLRLWRRLRPSFFSLRPASSSAFVWLLRLVWPFNSSGFFSRRLALASSAFLSPGVQHLRQLGFSAGIQTLLAASSFAGGTAKAVDGFLCRPDRSGSVQLLGLGAYVLPFLLGCCMVASLAWPCCHFLRIIASSPLRCKTFRINKAF